MKRETTVSSAPQTNHTLSKTSDKSDKNSLEASSDCILSLLSRVSQRLNRRARRRCAGTCTIAEGRDSGIDWVPIHDLRLSTLDSAGKPEQPMSRAEARAE